MPRRRLRVVGERSSRIHPPGRARSGLRRTLGAMRDHYQEQLDALAGGLADMCGEAALALDKATRALLEADLRLAEEVISGDVDIDDTRAKAEELAFALL